MRLGRTDCRLSNLRNPETGTRSEFGGCSDLSICLRLCVIPVLAQLLLPTHQGVPGGQHQVDGVAQQPVGVVRGGGGLAHGAQHAGVAVRRGDAAQHLVEK